MAQVRDTKFGTSVSTNSYLMLQNAGVIAFTVSELLRESQYLSPSVNISKWVTVTPLASAEIYCFLIILTKHLIAVDSFFL